MLLQHVLSGLFSSGDPGETVNSLNVWYLLSNVTDTDLDMVPYKDISKSASYYVKTGQEILLVW